MAGYAKCLYESRGNPGIPRLLTQAEASTFR
jgi:hypothetical protein